MAVQKDPQKSYCEEPQLDPAERGDFHVVKFRSISQVLKEKQPCFIFKVTSESVSRPYNQGGVGRCTDEKAEKHLLERMEIFLYDEKHQLFLAADILQSGPSHDLYAIVVYYHWSRYIKFAQVPITKEGVIMEISKGRSEESLQRYLASIRRKIVHQ